ncbi:MAG TPA: 2Fe-2S iron-sulfur cluster-binding protein, partial [Microthrixaceae bacterium]|nr:2Fe-2S iron-sulfur cluster-binding protein [Microthrixaceae bacterium]
DSIEAAGQLAPSGCRNGICHTCSTEVIDGCALNLRDGRIVEAGQHVQLCISAPLTDLTLAL